MQMFFHNSINNVIIMVILQEAVGANDEYNTQHEDGSYEFGYNNPDSYHYADANRNNLVRGEFGGRNPGTGAIDSTVYTAGPRGYRPRGKNVVRKYDLNQNGPRPVGSKDDPYYDPLEDPSYSFNFRTRTYNREENSNRFGDVNGRYSYVDDVGERHNVEFIAGKNTGFHVKTPFPDSNPRAYGPLYFNGRGRPIPRGRTSIQRGTDGSYRFVSSGPDQRRTEVSDSTGHVRGSYTYLDDKGVQHSVHYIAGPETGYRVLKQVKGPHLPTVFPFGRPEIIPPDFYNVPKDSDVFDTAASGHFRPGANKPFKPSEGVEGTTNRNKIGVSGGATGAGGVKDEIPSINNDIDKDDFSFSNKKPFGENKPNFGTFGKPSYIDEETSDFGDLFGGQQSSSTTSRPSTAEGNEGSINKSGVSNFGDNIDSSFNKPSAVDDSYRQSTESNYDSSTTLRPSFGVSTTTLRPVTPLSSHSSDFGYEIGMKPSFEKRPTRPTNIQKPGKRPGGKPNYEDQLSSEKVDDSFGLFGSESGRPRPPYPSISTGSVFTDNGSSSYGTSDGPQIDIGVSNDCSRCTGTLVTNVGNRVFSIPPGVSVRAHVQAIDLLPINRSVPSPSEQYKADLEGKTEQLIASDDGIVNTVEKVENNNNNTAQDNTTNSTNTI